ncbi:MAG: hypothetical protein ACLR0N_10510 [Bilophila wadsworthia]
MPWPMTPGSATGNFPRPNFIQALLDGGKDGRFMRIAPGFTPDPTVTEPLQPCG